MASETSSSQSKSLLSISQGAGLHVVGHAMQNIVLFVLQLILTRSLGASIYGIYSFGVTILNICYVFGNLGSDKSALKYIPVYRGQRQQSVILSLAAITSIVASSIISVLIYYFAPFISSFTLSSPLLVDALRVLAIVIPFNTLSNLVHSIFKGIERKDYEVVSASIFAPISRLVLIGGALLLGYSIIGAVAAYVVAGIISFVFALYIFWEYTDIRASFEIDRETAVEYYDYTIPLTVGQIGSILYNRVDILMVGYFLSSSAVGIYNISVTLAGALTLALAAFNQLLPPIASELHHKGKKSELSNIYSIVTRWIFTVTLFPGCVMVVYSKEILSIFGSEFRAGSMVLILFVVAQLFNSVAGPSGYLLMMTDHQYVSMYNQIVFGGLNIVLNYILITRVGFIGAAMATASILAAANITKVVEVWHLEEYFPYDKSYLGVLFGGASAIAVMHGLSWSFSGILLVIVGSTIGACVFAYIVYLYSITEADREFYHNSVNRLR